jgi:hypothetical protein
MHLVQRVVLILASALAPFAACKKEPPPTPPRAALRLAGALDEHDHWTGGRLVVVQTGDQLDRGDDEPEILDLLERLEMARR